MAYQRCPRNCKIFKNILGIFISISTHFTALLKPLQRNFIDFLRILSDSIIFNGISKKNLRFHGL